MAQMRVSSNSEKVWVCSKVNPGWYVAKWTWDLAYAQDLERIGYQVQKSVDEPVNNVE